MRSITHCFPKFEAYYKGYGLTRCHDGRCTASSDTPELYDKMDYPNIGFGHAVDKGRSYDCDAICKRIDEVIDERERRIGWVREFAKTQRNRNWTERYLLESCDTYNEHGHMHRSHHTEAEMYVILQADTHLYLTEWGIGYAKTSRTKYLYRRFLIEKGYITNNR